jgi:hypothetical protein
MKAGGLSATMIEGVSSAGRIGTVALAALRYAQPSGERAVLPVRPADMRYASFRHIQLLPDTRAGEGVPLYKLKILDALIERIAGASGSARPGAAPREEQPVDERIRAISAAIHRPGRGAPSWTAGLSLTPGSFVDLVA